MSNRQVALLITAIFLGLQLIAYAIAKQNVEGNLFTGADEVLKWIENKR